jgi:hypothetical protein
MAPRSCCSGCATPLGRLRHLVMQPTGTRSRPGLRGRHGQRPLNDQRARFRIEGPIKSIENMTDTPNRAVLSRQRLVRSDVLFPARRSLPRLRQGNGSRGDRSCFRAATKGWPRTCGRALTFLLGSMTGTGCCAAPRGSAFTSRPGRHRPDPRKSSQRRWSIAGRCICCRLATVSGWLPVSNGRRRLRALARRRGVFLQVWRPSLTLKAAPSHCLLGVMEPGSAAWGSRLGAMASKMQRIQFGNRE